MFGSVTTAVQLMVKVGADVSEAQSKLRGMSHTFKEVSGSAMKIGGAMTLGITTPLVTAGLAVTKFASDLSESTNKARVVFGDQAAAIEKWSAASAKAFGMSRQQALDAAGTFGNLFTSMGLAVDQSSQMSQGLVQLAADLASFNNIDPGVALEKLRAGMVGEVEPLRTLGISLSAAAVEAKAFEMGLAATAAELTEADKAAARYALIVQQSSNAQGDFARTADGLANQTRIVKAQLADAAATLGEKLLPYVLKLAEFVSQVLTGFANLDPQIQTFIMGIAAVAAALGPAVAFLGVMGTVIGALLSPIGLVVAAVVGLAAIVVNHFGGMQGTIQAASAVWTNTLQPALATVWEFIQANVIPVLQQMGAWLETNIPEAVRIMADFWTNTLQPALAAVWEFIQSDVIPILQEVGAWLSTNIPEAVRIMADFWTNTLQPALAAVWSFIQDNVVPILATLLTWLADNLPVAIQGLADFWTNTLQPALAAVWSFIQDNVVPILETLLTWLANNLPPAIEELKRLWANVLLPAITTVWAFIEDHIIPLFRALANVWIALVKVELKLMAGIWENVVKPALEKVWGFIQDHVIPIFETLANNLKGPIGDALNWFKDSILVPVAGAIDAIGSAIDGVIGWLQKMADKLASIHLPDWLTPGSPTPFELGLLGINRALRTAAGDGLPAFKLSLENIGPIIKEIVEIFRQLGEYFGNPAKGIGTAKAVTDALEPIFSNLVAIMDGLTAILNMGDLTAMSAKVDAIVVVLRKDLPLLVAAFVDVARLFKTDALAAAVVFAEAAGKLTAPMRDMVDAFTAVAEWSTKEIAPVLGLFMLELRKLARAWIAAAAIFNADMLAGALWFASVAGVLVAPLKAMVEGFSAVATWVPDHIAVVFGFFMLELRKLARAWKAAAAIFDADMLAGALWFASVAGVLVAPLKAMVDGFSAVVTWVPDHIAVVFGFFMLELRKLARQWIAAAAIFDADLLAGATVFADAAGRLVAPIKTMVSAFEDLAGWSGDQITPLMGLFMLQMRKLARQWVAAGQLFDADLLAGATAFADAAGRLVAPIKTMVSAFEDLAGWSGEQITPLMGLFMLQMRKLARQWVAAGQLFDADLLAGATAFADAAGRLVAPIKTMVSAFEAIADYKPEAIGPTLNTLFAQLRGLIRKLVRLAAEFDQEGVAAAEELAKSAGVMAGQLKTMVTAFEAIADYKPEAIGPTLNTLFDQLRGMVRKLVRLAAEFDQEGVAAAAAFMASVGAMIKTLGDALDLLTKIKTYVGPSANALLAFERDVEDMLLRFARWVVFVIQPIAADIDSDAMQAMQDMVNGLSAALELLNGLVDYVAPSAASLSAFMDGVQQLAEDFIDWATTNGPQLFREIPPEFLSAFQAVFEGLRAAVDVLTSLVDFVAPSVMAVMSFEEGYQRLFLDWVTWVQNNFSQTTNDLLVAIAAVFQQVMDGLATAVDVLTALVDFVAPSAFAVTTFEEGYQRLFEDWVTWATGTFENLNTELVAAVASVFGNVFDGIGAAVATLTALSGYVSPGLTAITAFETDYQRLFTGFVNWVETTFTDLSTDLVVAMTGAASALFQGLGAAATTLTQITGYVGPTETTITRFEQDYQRLATGFANWAESTWTEELAATTTAVGNAVNALYQGLGTAATTLSLIRNYTPASQAVIDRFIADMTNVMGTMLTWVETSFGVDAQAIMTSFGNTTQALFSGLGTALNVLQGIAAYTVPDSQFVLALQRFNANLLTAITSWQIWLTNTFTPETAALVQQFHTILSGIVTDMQAALQLLMDIDQASLPTADELIAFLDAVAQLFDGVIALFGGVTTEISGLVQAMADAFQEIFDTIEIAVSDFGSTLYAGLGQLFSTLAGQMWAWGDYAAGMFMSGLLAGMQNINSQNAVINAMRDLAEQLEEELRAAWGLHSPSRVAMGIGEMFVEGLALGLRDLADIPAMIQNELALGGVALGADVRFSPAPRHDRLTIEFQGAYQAGMSPAEEKRITSAMVGELRRQGLALQVARV